VNVDKVMGWLVRHPDLLVGLTGVTVLLAMRNFSRAVEIRSQLRGDLARRASEALGG
jgi:hypothetical protein